MRPDIIFFPQKYSKFFEDIIGFFREALSLLNLEILYDSVFCSKVMVEERCVKSDKAQWWFAGSLSTLIYTLKDSILQESGPLSGGTLCLWTTEFGQKSDHVDQ